MSTGKIKVPTTNDDLIPWTLPIARLIYVNFDGSERPAFLCKAGAKAYGLPDGFATGALLNLDTSDLGEVKRFIEAYGLPFHPTPESLSGLKNDISLTMSSLTIQ